MLIPVVVSIVIGLLLVVLAQPINEWIHTTYRMDPKTNYRVNWWEFALGLIIIIGVITPLIYTVGGHMAQDQASAGYHEFWNGSLVAAVQDTHPCNRDGDCEYHYQCDPYTVTIDDSYTDGQGNVHYSSHTETRYHSCPFATLETTYWVLDSFKQTHSRWSATFPADAQRWRSDRDLPNYVGRGAPKDWQEISDQIAAGDNPPAGKDNTYVNYLLASTNSILKAYSPEIDKYNKRNLLPDHTKNWQNPVNDWEVSKVNVAAGANIDVQAWNASLNRLNAALGTELQGDIHMVVVPASKVENPQSYINAVTAYWSSPAFGRRALAKNAIAIAVGVSNDGKTVKWVKAKTAMPTGNGGMKYALGLVRDVPADPNTFIGYVKASYKHGELQFAKSHGVIEDIVLYKTPFQRPCMECKDKTDHGTSYVYLKKDVKIPTNAKWIMGIVAVLLNITVWVLLLSFPMFENMQKLKRKIYTKNQPVNTNHDGDDRPFTPNQKSRG